MPTAEDWYDSSVSLLKNGRKFNLAAIQLRKAIGMQDQTKYHVALGCALAARAASLAQATVDRSQFAMDQAKYQEWLKAWETAQKDPSSPDNSKPPPEPPTLLTKDDQLPFVLTREEAIGQFKVLVKDAVAEWDRALSRVKTDQERAEMDYVRGWGLELIRVYGERANWADLPKAAENTKLLLNAIRLAPKNALYWQSLGDLYMDLGKQIDQPADKLSALSAYRQALTLKKTNANLWYRLYNLSKQDDPEQAKEAIRQAAQADADNAYPAYRLAGMLFGETSFGAYDRELTRSFKENEGISAERFHVLEQQIRASPDYAKMRQSAEAALAGVEQGNRAPHYSVPYYEPPFPTLLKAAWYLSGNPFDPTFDTKDWNKISVCTGVYIKSTVQEGDKAAAEHAAHILVDLGVKMAGDLLDKPVPLPKAEFMRLIVAFGIARQGYGYLLEAYNEVEDTASAAQVDPEYKAFKEKYNQYMDAALKALHNSYGEN